MSKRNETRTSKEKRSTEEETEPIEKGERKIQKKIPPPADISVEIKTPMLNVVATPASINETKTFGEGIEGQEACSRETKEEAEYRLHEQYYRLFPRRALLDSWNDLIKSIIPKIISARSLTLMDKTKVVPKKYRWGYPKITMLDASNMGITYSAPLRIEMHHIAIRNGEEVVLKKDEWGFEVPVMLRSSLCLSNRVEKNPIALEAMGMCRYDPGCYFIINGNPKKVNCRKQLRWNQVQVYTGPRLSPTKAGSSKHILQARITYALPIGTVVIAIEATKKNRIKIQLPFLDRKVKKSTGESEIVSGNLSMPIFSIMRLFYLLMVTDPNGQRLTLGRRDYVKQISRMAPRQYRAKIEQVLRPSLIHVLGTEEFDEQTGITNDLEYYRKKTNSKLSDALIIERFRLGFQNAFFGFIRQKFDTDAKPLGNYLTERYDTFCLTIVELCYRMEGVGIKDEHNRNGWDRNRFTTPADQARREIGALYAQKMEDVQSRVASKTDRFDKVIAELSDDRLTKKLNSDFASGKWGANERSVIQDVSAPVKTNNIIVLNADILKVKTDSGERSRNLEVRRLPPTGLGFQGPGDTPESLRCGLVNSATIGATVSRVQDINAVYRSIYDRLVHQTDDNNVVLLNGGVVGYANNENSLVDFVRDMRRRGLFPGISVYQEDNVINIYCDESRPLRPLLIVDPDGRLAIDKPYKTEEGGKIVFKNQWNFSFRELLTTGAVEMIDPSEQIYTTIAQKYTDILFREENKRNLENRIIKLNSEIASINKYILASDPLVDTPLEISQRLEKQGYDELAGLARLDREIVEKDVAAKQLEVIRTQRQLETENIKRPYTHTEMNPREILSLSEAVIPFAPMNPSTRITYECKQLQQAIGHISSVETQKFETTAKSLYHARRGLIETEMMSIIGGDILPFGETVNIAICNYDGWNQEDAIIFNQKSIEVGGAFWYSKTMSFEYYLNKDRSKEYTERFAKPPLRRKIGDPEKSDWPGRYDAINEDGIPIIDAEIKPRMAIIGVIREYHDKSRADTIVNVSLFARPDVRGYVDRVLINNPNSPNAVLTVRIRQFRQPIAGDKFSLNPGQKATISHIAASENMPFASLGDKQIEIDVIVNPLAFTSRMTNGTLTEVLASYYASIVGKRVDASAFKKFNQEEWEKSIRDYGFNPTGKYKLMRGDTGEFIDAKIFTGPAYLKMLNHNILDKIRNRATGKIDPITRQPIKGQKAVGGVKMGEMERDAFIAHGAAFLINERFYYSSDRARVPFCKNCGYFAIMDVGQKRFRCLTCGNRDLEGFGEVKIPYIYKVFMDTLSTIGIRFFHRLREKRKRTEVETLPDIPSAKIEKGTKKTG
jgi:DNA-directed RNA polymerase beta subunit